jgi:hypothetical protein
VVSLPERLADILCSGVPRSLAAHLEDQQDAARDYALGRLRYFTVNPTFPAVGEVELTRLICRKSLATGQPHGEQQNTCLRRHLF